MYYFFLFIFSIVSILLIFLILIQPSSENNFSLLSSSSISNLFNEKMRNSFIIKLISFLSVIFFILSILLCKLNNF